MTAIAAQSATVAPSALTALAAAEAAGTAVGGAAALFGAAMFYLLAAAAVASALGVVVSRNIVRMAVFLLFTLASVAGLYFLLHAEFLAAVQIVVYVGGTLILIIFGVMLTSKSPFSRLQPRRGEVIAAALIGVTLTAALVAGLLLALKRGQLGHGPQPATGPYPVQGLGQALLGDFLVPFELASVLLLVVMIGAAYLAKARRRREP